MTKILLVEDDKSLREIYGVRLLAEGYDIVSAGDGEEALAMAIKEKPGLIVSDVMMPKISGFDMLDILRSTTETKDIKVIMMTALSSEDQRLRGEQLGADRYLVKSQVGIEDVVRTVHDVLGDAPVSQPSAQQFFSQPAPSAIPRPAASTNVPPRPQAPAYPSPQAPTAAPAPVAPAPSPFAAPAPTVAPTPAPAPTFQPSSAPASTLPQPTAPFSSQRPANLADRIIHPLESNVAPGPDVSALMDNELNSDVVGQIPTPPVPPSPQPSYEAPATPPQAPQAPQSGAISYEETPRPEQTPPTSNPFGGSAA
jgi:CheY-like chemotaxis protein